MKKFVCTICGYVHEGDAAPARCPQCNAPDIKFNEQKEGMAWAAEHVVGVAKGVDPEIIEGLRMNFNGECTEVGMYLAMARVAHREGYPEIGLYWEKAAWEEAEHAAKFAELLGEVVTDSTKKNLEMRVEAENGATCAQPEYAAFLGADPAEVPTVCAAPDNEEALEEELRRLIASPQLLEERGEAGREFMRRYHEADAVAARLEKILAV